MTLKSMFEKFDINLERMILKYYKELGLSTQDMVILLILIQIYIKKPVFSMQSLSKKVDYSLKDVEKSVEHLIEKNYIFIYHEQNKQGKQQEMFHLDVLFQTLSTYLDAQPKLESNASDLQKVVILLESYLNREMYAKELQQLRYFIDEEKYQVSDILAIIEELKDKVTMFKLEKMLSVHKKIPKIEVNQEQDRALDALFKQIK